MRRGSIRLGLVTAMAAVGTLVAVVPRPSRSAEATAPAAPVLATDEEIALGLVTADALVAGRAIDDADPRARRVAASLAALAAAPAARATPWQWSARVVDLPAPVLHALPGGTLVVGTATLAALDDAALAAALAHAMGHVMARHAGEAIDAHPHAPALAAAVRASEADARAAGATLARLLPTLRVDPDAEREADALGSRLGVTAKWNSRCAPPMERSVIREDGP